MLIRSMEPTKGGRPGLFMLAMLVARDSNLTFGGGTATAEVLRRSFAKRGWLEDSEHRRLYAISRLTPGTNLLAYCTALGWRIRGSKGVMVAWLSSSLPAAVMAVLATVLYERLAASPTLAAALLFATGVALVLLLASAWHLARPHLVRDSLVRSLSVIVLVIVLEAVGMPPIGTLLSAAALGAMWKTPTE